MFGQFFFLTQYLQGVQGFSPVEAGIAFLPLTLVMFAMTNLVPSLVARFGDTAVLGGGMVVALAGMAWLSRIGPATPYLTGVAMPMAVLAVGAAARLHRSRPPASPGSPARTQAPPRSRQRRPPARRFTGPRRSRHRLRLGVAAGAGSAAASPTQANALAHAISTSLTAGTVMLGAALAIVLILVRPQRPATVSVEDLPLVDVEEQLAA